MPTRSIWQRMRWLNQRLVRRYGNGPGPWNLVLLLTTTGRKSGLPRVTPLQYEVLDGVYYIGSALGSQADWFRNIQANREVRLRVGERQFDGLAEPVTDPDRVVEFLRLRLNRHPIMLRLVMAVDGLPPWANRARFEAYARSKTVAAVHPCPPIPTGQSHG